MAEINILLAERLKQLGASQLPSPVLASIQSEVEAWRDELTEKATVKLRDRVERQVTKPWIARHFAAQFKRLDQTQEGA